MLVCLCCDFPVARGAHSANLAVRVSLPLGGAAWDQGQSQGLCLRPLRASREGALSAWSRAVNTCG